MIKLRVYAARILTELGVAWLLILAYEIYYQEFSFVMIVYLHNLIPFLFSVVVMFGIIMYLICSAVVGTYHLVRAIKRQRLMQ